MELNDGSQYRVITDPIRHMQERELYCFRAGSSRNGTMYIDTAFQHHRDTLSSMRGLLAYQYVYVAASPEATADFFISTMGGSLRENEMVMVDPESGGGFTNANAPGWVSRWLARVETALDTRAWVYVPSALTAGLSKDFTKDRLIMAPRYTRDPVTGLMSPLRGQAPWWPHDVHQFTDNGYFPGCKQSGDTSYTTLAVDEMLRRCNPNGITPVHGPGGAVDG